MQGAYGPLVCRILHRLPEEMPEFPQLLHTVLDTTRPRELAEFYRELLDLRYRAGDERPADGTRDDADWLVLEDSAGTWKLAFQLVEELQETTWPSHAVPMQLHIDYTVSSTGELERQRKRAVDLGARVLIDRTDDSDERLYVLADPSGHPFCIFVA